jgi:DNA polymerase III subunit beta
MNFNVSSSALLKHLQSVQGVINPNPVLSIIENFLFEVKGNKLKISTTDLNTSMITSLDVEADGPLSMAIPSKILLETLKSLPEQPLSFNVDEDTNGIEIVTLNGKYKLVGEKGADFPVINEVSSANKITMPADALLSAINYTLFAVGVDELRPAMSGVLFQIDNNNINFVSTDAHKLAWHKYSHNESGFSGSFIVPKKAVNLLKSALPSSNIPVTLTFTDTNLAVDQGEITLYCRLIDQKFPDYNAVIPTNNPNKLVVNRLDFLNSLKRMAIYSSKTTYQVRLELTLNELVVSAEDLDYSNAATETLMCEYEGEEMSIGFSARFLIDMLSTFSTTNAKLEFSLPSKPGLLFPDEKVANEETLMLIMPVMLAARNND